MTALIRFGLVNLLHSQRYLPPTLLYLIALVVFTANDYGPLIPVYASSSGALFVCAVWLTVATINAEDPVHRTILLAGTGRPVRVLIASVIVVFLGCLTLATVGLLLPLVMGRHTPALADLVTGLGAELVCALIGTTVGLICSRLVIPRHGVGVLVAVATVLALLVLPGVPPVNPLLRMLGHNTSSIALLVPIGGFIALAGIMISASIVITHRIASHRD